MLDVCLWNVAVATPHKTLKASSGGISRIRGMGAGVPLSLACLLSFFMLSCLPSCAGFAVCCLIKVLVFRESRLLPKSFITSLDFWLLSALWFFWCCGGFPRSFDLFFLVSLCSGFRHVVGRGFLLWLDFWIGFGPRVVGFILWECGCIGGGKGLGWNPIRVW